FRGKAENDVSRPVPRRQANTGPINQDTCPAGDVYRTSCGNRQFGRRIFVDEEEFAFPSKRLQIAATGEMRHVRLYGAVDDRFISLAMPIPPPLGCSLLQLEPSLGQRSDARGDLIPTDVQLEMTGDLRRQRHRIEVTV